MNTLKVTQTDTITCLYAKLPIVDLNVRYLIQVMAPIPQIPMEIKIPYNMAGMDNSPLDSLKEKLLKDWHKNFVNKKKALKASGSTWVLDVNKVKLVECDLLTPKASV